MPAPKTDRYLVYALHDPRDWSVRYIGKSTSSLQRPRAHVTRSAFERTHKARWIQSILREGLEPGVSILQRCERAADLSEAERHWIAHYRSNGTRLTNATDGGNGCLGRVSSPETRAKKRAKMLGFRHSDETKRRISLSKAGRQLSEEHKAKLSAAFTGRKMSPEAIAKSAEKRRGRKMSVAYCERNRQAQLANPYVRTAEHRRKLSRAGKGVRKSPEWRARMSAIRRAMPDEVRRRPHTAETRAKMMAAHRLTNADGQLGLFG